MRSNACVPGATNASSPGATMRSRSWSSSVSTRCRRLRRRNAARSISARTGLVLGEGAAILALENLGRRESARSANSCRNRRLRPLHGQSSPDPAEPFRERRAPGDGARVGKRGDTRPPTSITSTRMAPPRRLTTPRKARPSPSLFGRVPVSSTKGMMGHSFGAAGAIEAVISFSLCGIRFLPPNINFRTTEIRTSISNIVANSSSPARLRTVLSNSFGFGGTNASVILRAFAA